PAAPEAPPPVAGPPPAPAPGSVAALSSAPVMTGVQPRPDTGDLPADPVFARVVAAVEEFSPLVEVIGPGRCAISAAAPARYFGGEQALLAKLTDAITALGLTCQAGVADGLFAAQLAAQAVPPESAVPAASQEISSVIRGRAAVPEAPVQAGL